VHHGLLVLAASLPVFSSTMPTTKLCGRQTHVYGPADSTGVATDDDAKAQLSR
jgi:hypothetical protein